MRLIMLVDIFIDQYQNKIEILMIKGSKETLCVEEMSREVQKETLTVMKYPKKGPLIWKNGMATVC